MCVVLLAVALPTTPARGAVLPVNGRGQSPSDFLMWLKCADVFGMTDADLDMWKRRGVDGFACNIQWVKDMGGTQDFTRDKREPVDGPELLRATPDP